MSGSVWLLIAAVSWLAYANGANDNFKGVATLFGTDTTDYRGALVVATLSTFAGGLAAAAFGGALIRAFSGKGLVAASVLADPTFLTSVGLAAAATVVLATRVGMPVSTTHAIVGALAGAGVMTEGGIALDRLGEAFLLPLIATPIATAAATVVLYLAFRRIRFALRVERETCICVGEREQGIGTEISIRRALAAARSGAFVAGDSSASLEAKPALEFRAGTTARCVQRYRGRVVGIDAQTALDVFHYLSAAAVGFVRGLQDTAKIVGLLVGVGFVTAAPSPKLFACLAGLAVLMAVGGIVNGTRVAATISRDITPMNAGQGFTANLVSSTAVAISALFGLGVSTTHCTVGALFGIAAVGREADERTIGAIALAWVTTLPMGAAAGAVAYALLR